MADNIDLTKLPIEQLDKVRKQMEKEVQFLQTSTNQLREAEMRFLASKRAITNLGKCSAGDQTMAPLTPSLYVPSTLKDPQHVTVDIGTGYYAKMDIESAEGFMDRKIAKIKENNEKVIEALDAKQKNIEVLQMVIQRKVQASM
eukprot:TRINITY_DN26468_c0_g1_i1.p1 TRINITY_DN26468_c0_g1~~TRINITY_DN26468_c0_g1_i1.p1  ORF type:complete len:144 (+),score=50.00 TRINITY_DN26468_c0_g1_i1:35-466(+)